MYVVRPAAVAAAVLGLALSVLGTATSATASGPASGSGSAASSPPVVYAHRGASAYAPENTLASIDLAMRMGIDWVENDVQRTRDGVLVVIHDDNLARTTDVEQVFPDRKPWLVKDFTADEIALLDAGSWFGKDEQYAGATVPTLREYLARVRRNQQKLLLEIKRPEIYPGIERETLNLLDATGWLDRNRVERRLVVQSFSADSIRIVHDLRPDLVTAFLGTPTVAELPRYAAFTDRINPWHTTLSADWVAAVHALRGPHGKAMEVDTWTVDNAATARKVQEMGVDGIITNTPDVVRRAVGWY
ncbi:glycerophosphodiester phosphodiesterase [Streptomyces sp. NPDC054949]|uniref:glycerophosphodiester phosphodiesterase n=1 Tax=unclassified Streptomyces TaxID=2593676 RepID=UPI0006AF0DD4|nr:MULTISPECIES: glycerophosphodiester phosphodiesterase family protein [unclassified Streptomyces]KOU44075.1 glycerophosphodiester phosphodiesterase [Streptomyces sp. WM4235]MCX5076011.1 glycerophosphodiester phosphodiesterase family protein [Streptomyces sp. NBC_00424]WUD40921.1 glycerophosphodiester phosphodiesterase family protein [Streptomyces sp. NBC_00513]